MKYYLFVFLSFSITLSSMEVFELKITRLEPNELPELKATGRNKKSHGKRRPMMRKSPLINLKDIRRRESLGSISYMLIKLSYFRCVENLPIPADHPSFLEELIKSIDTNEKYPTESAIKTLNHYLEYELIPDDIRTLLEKLIANVEKLPLDGIIDFEKSLTKKIIIKFEREILNILNMLDYAEDYAIRLALNALYDQLNSISNLIIRSDNFNIYHKSKSYIERELITEKIGYFFSKVNSVKNKTKSKYYYEYLALEAISEFYQSLYYIIVEKYPEIRNKELKEQEASFKYAESVIMELFENRFKEGVDFKVLRNMLTTCFRDISDSFLDLFLDYLL